MPRFLPMKLEALALTLLLLLSLLGRTPNSDTFSSERGLSTLAAVELWYSLGSFGDKGMTSPCLRLMDFLAELR